ncbi:peptide chain release factor 1 [Acrasis kona]|uniref:Peptide chain release factor 1 n=1 Tax=Acrasis kona TaxID=1008807 RepID=A0AAW2YKP9_9EUKA
MICFDIVPQVLLDVYKTSIQEQNVIYRALDMFKGYRDNTMRGKLLEPVIVAAFSYQGVIQDMIQKCDVYTKDGIVKDADKVQFFQQQQYAWLNEVQVENYEFIGQKDPLHHLSDPDNNKRIVCDIRNECGLDFCARQDDIFVGGAIKLYLQGRPKEEWKNLAYATRKNNSQANVRECYKMNRGKNDESLNKNCTNEREDLLRFVEDEIKHFLFVTIMLPKGQGDQKMNLEQGDVWIDVDIDTLNVLIKSEPVMSAIKAVYEANFREEMPSITNPIHNKVGVGDKTTWRKRKIDEIQQSISQVAQKSLDKNNQRLYDSLKDADNRSRWLEENSTSLREYTNKLLSGGKVESGQAFILGLRNRITTISHTSDVRDGKYVERLLNRTVDGKHVFQGLLDISVCVDGVERKATILTMGTGDSSNYLLEKGNNVMGALFTSSLANLLNELDTLRRLGETDPKNIIDKIGLNDTVKARQLNLFAMMDKGGAFYLERVCKNVVVLPSDADPIDSLARNDLEITKLPAGQYDVDGKTQLDASSHIFGVDLNDPAIDLSSTIKEQDYTRMEDIVKKHMERKMSEHWKKTTAATVDRLISDQIPRDLTSKSVGEWVDMFMENPRVTKYLDLRLAELAKQSYHDLNAEFKKEYSYAADRDLVSAVTYFCKQMINEYRIGDLKHSEMKNVVFDSVEKIVYDEVDQEKLQEAMKKLEETISRSKEETRHASEEMKSMIELHGIESREAKLSETKLKDQKEKEKLEKTEYEKHKEYYEIKKGSVEERHDIRESQVKKMKSESKERRK